MAVYECSFSGCSGPTESHYCMTHRRHCSECGEESTAADLLDGRCRECHRIDFGGYVGCENACCYENAPNVVVDGVSRWA